MRITRPNRIKHAYSQIIIAAPEIVFPLLCPVQEEKWVHGWNPAYVLSFSGVAEPDCIFQTSGESANSVWIVNRHEPERFYVEMYKVTPEHTVGKLQIQLSLINEHETKADISYEYTSLGNSGDEFMKKFTTEYYVEFMKNWEQALNHFLERGEKSAEPPPAGGT